MNMPNRDGTGPLGNGPRTGRMRNRVGGFQCSCPKCGHKVDHQRGIPCSEKTCPKCGEFMRGVNCLNS